MSDDRHISGTTGGDAAHLLLGGARRRAVAAEDIFLPEALRLGEWLRGTVRALLGKYVRAVEAELRAALADDPVIAAHDALHASLSSAHVQIVLPLLERSNALRDHDLIAALVRRAEEHRFQKSRPAPADRSLLSRLIGGDDPALADQAMALLVAQSRRFDRFQEPVLARTELPADLQHRLAWTIAAALRVYMVERHGLAAAAADQALAAAVSRLLAAYDEGDTLEARCARLARSLDDAGHLDDALVGGAVEDGNLPLFVALLAARSGLSGTSVWEIAMEAEGRGAALLLRAADIGRDTAAAILVALSFGGTGISSPGEVALEAQLDLFDVTDAETARGMLALWRVDPAYRAAVARLMLSPGGAA